MRRFFNDALISVGGLAILLLVLVSIDPRVREHVSRIGNGVAAGEIGGTSAGDLGSIVMLAALDQSVAHAPLVLFAVAAAVLFFCMLRT